MRQHETARDSTRQHETARDSTRQHETARDSCQRARPQQVAQQDLHLEAQLEDNDTREQCCWCSPVTSENNKVKGAQGKQRPGLESQDP
jgi:hypothetical protein